MKKIISLVALIILTATTVSAQWLHVGNSDWAQQNGQYVEKTGLTAILTSKDIVVYKGTVYSPKLELTCSATNQNAMVAFDARVPVKGDTVEYMSFKKVNDTTMTQSIVRQAWVRLTTGTGWYSPFVGVPTLLRVLEKSDTFTIKFVDVDGNSHLATFALGDVSKEVEKMKKLCPTTHF